MARLNIRKIDLKIHYWHLNCEHMDFEMFAEIIDIFDIYQCQNPLLRFGENTGKKQRILETLHLDTHVFGCFCITEILAILKSMFSTNYSTTSCINFPMPRSSNVPLLSLHLQPTMCVFCTFLCKKVKYHIAYVYQATASAYTLLSLSFFIVNFLFY